MGPTSRYSLTVTKLDRQGNETGAHAAQGRMFVTYPQCGNGQRQVMCERNMFLPFHIHRLVCRSPGRAPAARSVGWRGKGVMH